MEQIIILDENLEKKLSDIMNSSNKAASTNIVGQQKN